MDLSTTIDLVRNAIEDARGVLPEDELRIAEDQIEDALRRRELVGGHTVVALVGGTGSGKSSLFNLLTHSDHAEVGVLRPTTRRPAACTWGRPPTELLDHLGIAAEELTTRDTFLTHSEKDRALEGLVLLDLPDQDSVVAGHADTVDRLVPLVDLLIWMVDPQKYADHVLHERYLGPLAARADSMVVVINHADALTSEGLAKVQRDVRRILDDGGLESVLVLTTSVPTEEGIDAVRDRIAEVVRQGSSSDATARAQVAGVANWLSRRVGEEEPDLTEASIAPTVEALVRASGTDAVAESIERSLSRLTGSPVAAVEPPARAAVAAIGSGWAGHAKHGLPKPWDKEVDRALPSVETLTHAVGAAVASVPLPESRVRKADQWLIGAVGAFVLGLGILLAGSIAGWPVALYLTVSLALMAGAGGLAGVSMNTRRQEADTIARAYAGEARQRVAATVSEILVEPTRQVLAKHRRIRESLEHARG